MKRQSNLKEGE